MSPPSSRRCTDLRARRACAILFHGLRDRHLPEVWRGARWLFAPYAVLAAACLLLGGPDALGEFLASFVTWTHIGIVIAVAVAVGFKDLLDRPPDPREGAPKGPTTRSAGCCDPIEADPRWTAVCRER